MTARKKVGKRKRVARKRRKSRLTAEEERTLFLKEQTLLAKERTILSFMRTGLGFITVGFAILAASEILGSEFSVNPAVSIVVGGSIVALGFLEIIESFRRLKTYKRKMKEVTQELGDEGV